MVAIFECLTGFVCGMYVQELQNIVYPSEKFHKSSVEFWVGNMVSVEFWSGAGVGALVGALVGSQVSLFNLLLWGKSIMEPE